MNRKANGEGGVKRERREEQGTLGALWWQMGIQLTTGDKAQLPLLLNSILCYASMRIKDENNI